MHQDILKAIKESAKNLSPISTLAQLYLESGYRPGKALSTLASPPNHNLFGIKASDPQFTAANKGKTWDLFWTKEWDDKSKRFIDIQAPFRIYPNYIASIKDHDEFFVSTPSRVERYKATREATNLKDEVRELGASGYATDPEYAKKINEIIADYKMEETFPVKDIAKFNKQTSGGVVNVGYIGIDIGHGANTRETGGGKAVYKNGKWHEEHDFNSMVAKALKAKLEKSGHKVTYGAQQPFSNEVGLTTRTNKFNELNVDVVVSIHANYVNNASVNGICAFYWHDHKESKRLGAEIMAQFKKQGQDIYSPSTGGNIASVPGTWTDFHMVRQTKMTAVLMELGFMSGNKDFDKVFGNQQSKYVEQMAQGLLEGINKFFGTTTPSETINRYNPKGLAETKLNAYRPPALAFKRFKVGDTVTFRDTFNSWYNPDTKSYMATTKAKDIQGTKDTIVEVKKVDIDWSEYAYLVKGYNSWVLEQDLVEPRAHWSTPVAPETPVTEDDDFALYELDGQWYKVEKVENP